MNELTVCGQTKEPWEWGRRHGRLCWGFEFGADEEYEVRIHKVGSVSGYTYSAEVGYPCMDTYSADRHETESKSDFESGKAAAKWAEDFIYTHIRCLARAVRLPEVE